MFIDFWFMLFFIIFWILWILRISDCRCFLLLLILFLLLFFWLFVFLFFFILISDLLFFCFGFFVFVIKLLNCFKFVLVCFGEKSELIFLLFDIWNGEILICFCILELEFDLWFLIFDMEWYFLDIFGDFFIRFIGFWKLLRFFFILIVFFWRGLINFIFCRRFGLSWFIFRGVEFIGGFLFEEGFVIIKYKGSKKW